MIFEKFELVSAHMPWFFPLAFFMFGACVGSFLNVCIYRLPKGVSIVRPSSRCACGEPIAWHDNIPVLSWFLLRGKARCCKRKFAFRYPLVEALTGFAFAYAYWHFTAPVMFIAMAFFALMLVVTFIDLDTLELPDVLTVGGIVAGFALSCAFPQLHTEYEFGGQYLFFALRSIMLSVFGAVLGAGILFLFKIIAESILNREAMGEGDLVLLACIGAFCGWQGAVFAIFGGSIMGSLIMVPVLIFKKIFSKKSESEMIPYGPWLALGGVAYMFCFKPFIDAHFSEIIQVFFK